MGLFSDFSNSLGVEIEHVGCRETVVPVTPGVAGAFHQQSVKVLVILGVAKSRNSQNCETERFNFGIWKKLNT